MNQPLPPPPHRTLAPMTWPRAWPRPPPRAYGLATSIQEEPPKALP